MLLSSLDDGGATLVARARQKEHYLKSPVGLAVAGRRRQSIFTFASHTDASCPPEHRPSSWSADELMALLVGATNYPRSINLAYRSALTLQAARYKSVKSANLPELKPNETHEIIETGQIGQPARPLKPTKSSKPAKSAKPVEPAKPAKPVEPGQTGRNRSEPGETGQSGRPVSDRPEPVKKPVCY